MIGIYHNKDLDGFTSGAIIKLKYPDAKMIGYDYGMKIDINVNNEPVIMADISFPMKDMLNIAKHSNWQLTWIDHHISAINDYKEFIGNGENFCISVLENGIAACESTWKYLFPDKEIPYSVKLLSEYDTWKNQNKDKWYNEILPFQYGIKVLCNSVETFPIEVFDNIELVEKIIENGKLIMKYQEQINEHQCKKCSFEIDFEGLKAICLNNGGFNSDVFKSVYNEEKHDIMICFQFNGYQWIFSLYTTKDNIDCSSLAKKRGGGGHKKAAGFQTNDIKSIINFI